MHFRRTQMFFTAEKFRHIFSKNLVRKFRQIIQSKFDEILRKSKFKILKWANIILTFKGAKKPFFEINFVSEFSRPIFFNKTIFNCKFREFL